MSRTFGDLEAKKIGVISEPDIIIKKIDSNAKYIVLGSDGLWDMVKPYDVIRIVRPFFNKGDILFNKLNVKFKRVWDIDFDINENSICSTEFIPIQGKHIDRNFLYYCLISPNFTNEMKYLSTGTSNSHQRINPKDIKDYDLFLPIDKEIQRKIGHILKLLDKKISINTEINKNF